MVIREVRDGVLYSCWAAILQLEQGLRNLNVLNLYVGATPHQSKINLIGWLDNIVLGASRKIKQSEDLGTGTIIKQSTKE